MVQAYASVQMNQDLGYSDSVYGFAAGVFFVSYAIFQARYAKRCAQATCPRLCTPAHSLFRHLNVINELDVPKQVPVQLAAQRYGLPRCIGIIMIGWGAVATAFAGLTSNPLHLYGLRFLLGFMEAGAFPWCGRNPFAVLTLSCGVF